MELLRIGIMACCIMAVGVRALCLTGMPCNCAQMSIVCNCNVPENSSKFLEFAPINITQKPQTISVSDCPVVRMRPAALSHFQLRKLEISRVDQLDIIGSSFLDLHGVDSISIRDVNIDTIPEFAFVSLVNIGSIEFVNVTVGNVTSRAFYALSRITNVTFVDCNINYLAPNAFNHSEQITYFHVKKSNINTLSSGSLDFQEVQNVLIEEVRIEHWKKHGLVLKNVSSVHLRNLTVGTMDSEAILGTGIRRFYFKNNKISTIRSNAFSGLSGVGTLIFENNFIEIAEKDSFLMTQKNSVTYFHVSGNVFTCSEEMCWLLDATSSHGLHKKLIETSTCRDKEIKNNSASSAAEIALEPQQDSKILKEMSISTMLSLLDDEDVCSNLESSGKTGTEMFSIPIKPVSTATPKMRRKNNRNSPSVAAAFQNGSRITSWIMLITIGFIISYDV